jgi:hypothetical protein
MGQFSDLFNTAWRDYVTDGVPSTGNNKPKKSEIRQIGGAIDEALTAAAAGIKTFTTWSDLSANPGTAAGQTAYVKGDEGTHTDPVAGGTVNNEGEFSWSTSPAGWERVGDYVDSTTLASYLDSINLNSALTKPRILGLSANIEGAIAFWDYNNDLGGGAGLLLLPKSLTIRKNGETTVTEASTGTVSTIPGYENYVPLVVTLGSTPIFITYNLTTHAYEQQTSAPAPSTNLVEMGTVNGKQFTSPVMQVITVGNDVPIAVPKGPIAVESDGTVYLPHFFSATPPIGAGESGTGSTTVANLHKKITGFALGSPRILAIDLGKMKKKRDLILASDQAGADAIDEFKIFSHTVIGSPDSFYPVLYGCNGHYSSPFELVGDVPGGRVDNQFYHGKDIGQANFLFAGTTGGDVVDPTLSADGITKTVRGAVGGGCGVVEPVPYPAPSGWVTMVVRVAMNVDDAVQAPPVPNAFVYKNVGGVRTTLRSPAMQLWSIDSARCRTYRYTFLNTNTDDAVAELGVFCSGIALYTIELGAWQFHYGPNPGWIHTKDFPPIAPTGTDSITSLTKTILSVPDESPLVIGSELMMIEERPLHLYPDALFPTLQPERGIDIDVSGCDAENAFYPFVGQTPGPVLVDARNWKGNIKVQARPAVIADDKAWQQLIEMRTVSAAKAATANVVLDSIGDSIARYGKLVSAAHKGQKLFNSFRSRGFLEAHAYDNYRSAWTNAISGRTGYAYTGFEDDADANLLTLPIGDEDWYLAQDEATRSLYNIYLVPAPVGTPEEWITPEGNVFSLKGGCERFGLPLPTHFLCAVFVNETVHKNHYTTGTFLTRVQDTVKIIGGMCKLECPEVHVAFLTDPVANTLNGNAGYADRLAVIYELYGAVKTLAHPRCTVISGHAMLPRTIDFNNTPVSATDSNTGVQTITMNDPTHYVGNVMETSGELITAWCAVTATENSQLEAAFKRMPTQPLPGTKAAVRDFVRDLFDGGMTADDFEFLNVSLDTMGQSVIDLMGTMDGAVIGSPSFSALRGFNSVSTTANVNTLFDPAGSVKHFSMTSHVMGFACGTDDGDANYDMGNSQFRISAVNSSGATKLRVGNGTDITLTEKVRGSLGTFMFRGDATTWDFYADSGTAPVESGARTPAGSATSATIRVGSDGTSGNSRRYIVWWAGHYWNDAKVSTFMAALEKYLRRVGGLVQGITRPLWTGMSPAQNATGVSRTPTLQTTALEARHGNEDYDHLTTEWEFWTGSLDSGTLVYSNRDAANKLSLTIPGGSQFPAATAIIGRHRHRSSVGLPGPWSRPLNFTTGA